MKNFKHYTKGLLSFALLFFISNTTMAAPTQTDGAVSNTTMFYVFLALALVMLLAIYFLSGAIKNLLASDYYKKAIYEKERKKREEGNITPLILLFVIATPFASFSQSEVAAGVESDMPIQWVWAMIVANAILAGVVLYLRGLFFEILRVVRPKKVVEKAGKKVKEPSKIAQILTDAVPIEREHEILTDHDYDGIRELDNNLPPWWLYSFYVSIVFAFIYLLNYHVFKTGDLQIAEYEESIVQGNLEIEEFKKTQKLNIDETNVFLLTDKSDIDKGKKVFMNNCVACHGANGEGGVGPNLTDDYWIHGGSTKDVFKLIKYGNPEKGMQSWKKLLGAVEIQQVTSYIKSIKGTVEGGKEPQGDLYVEEGEATETTNEATDSTVAVVDAI